MRKGKNFVVTIYRQSGFSLSHAPSSVSAFHDATGEITQHVFTDSLYARQSRFLSYIDLPTWEDTNEFYAEDADYCKISNTSFGDMYYYVTAVTYINDGTVRFSLVFDSVGTLAIAGKLISSIVGGEISRRHVTDDTEKWHNAPEPFAPTRPFTKMYFEVNCVTNTQTADLIVSSVRLENLKLAAATFMSPDGGFSTPAIPASTQNTRLIMGGVDSHTIMDMPKKAMYNADVYSSNSSEFSITIDGVSYNIPQTIRGLGLGNLITAAYSIPLDFFAGDPIPPASIIQLVTHPIELETEESIECKPTSGNQVFNRKTLYSYRRTTIISESSLNSDAYEAWELGDGNEEQYLKLVFVADPSPSGCIICKPSYIKNTYPEKNTGFSSYGHNVHRGVKSACWNAITIANEGGAVFPALTNFALTKAQIKNARDAAAIGNDATVQGLNNALALSKNSAAGTAIGLQSARDSLMTSDAQISNQSLYGTLTNTRKENALRYQNYLNLDAYLAQRVGLQIDRDYFGNTDAARTFTGASADVGAIGEAVTGASAGSLLGPPGTVIGGVVGTIHGIANTIAVHSKLSADATKSADYYNQMETIARTQNDDLSRINLNQLGQNKNDLAELNANLSTQSNANEMAYSRNAENSDLNQRVLQQAAKYNAQQMGIQGRSFANTLQANNIQASMNSQSLKSAYLQEPEYVSEAPVALSAAMLTKFMVIIEDLDPTDRACLDNYYSEYGYASPIIARSNIAGAGDSILQNAVFGRTVFNYIRFSSIMCNTGYVSSVNADLQARLLAGVTLWHERPANGKLWQANPNR